MPVTRGTYKGFSTITFESEDGKTKITLGGKKANAIAPHVSDLLSFARETASNAAKSQNDVTDRSSYRETIDRETLGA